CKQHPDRFIPFGHVRPIDDWQSELERITADGWIGLKLHQGELSKGGPDMTATTRSIVGIAARLGIRIVKIHLVDYAAVDSLAPGRDRQDHFCHRRTRVQPAGRKGEDRYASPALAVSHTATDVGGVRPDHGRKYVATSRTTLRHQESRDVVEKTSDPVRVGIA